MHTGELGRGAHYGITDRSAGSSATPYLSLNLSLNVGDDPDRVVDNRRRAATGLKLDPREVVWMQQTHGAEVAVVPKAPSGPVPGVDGLVTRSRNLALAVLVADCVPVLLAHGEAGVVGVAHAGRTGLAAGVVQATVAAMRSLGADPAEVTAIVGPAVGPCCYEVPSDLRDDVAGLVPETAAWTRAGTPALDLPTGVLAVLAGAGVRRCSRSPICTADDPAYFSHRRDKVTGRFAGYAWLA